MNAALSILVEASEHGVTVSLSPDGRAVTVAGERDAMAKYLPLLREHKAAIIAELQTEIPLHVRNFLDFGGYESKLTEWTPAACRAFLELLQAEWPGFHVNGWHGLTMPDSWPWETQSAVLSVYVMSIQEVTPCQ